MCVVETGNPKCAVAAEDRRAGGLRGEALRRVDLRDALAEGPDDPPAAGVGARAHRERRRRDHPGRRPSKSGLEVARGDERERDDPHRLLRVVRPVRERDERRPRRAAARRKPRFTFVGDRRAMIQVITRISTNAIATPRNGATSDGISTLSLIPPHCTTSAPAGRHRRADHPADQRVARARRQPEEPGDQVPRDRADEAGEHDVERDRVRVDDPLRDRRRDLDRDERAGEVQDRGARDGGARAERPRRDARRDRVRGVVEAVREVEEERDGDDRPERELPRRPSRRS